MALIERFHNTSDVTHWRGQIPMNYVYTAGRGNDMFFKAILEKGKFVGTRCDACGIVFLPPRIYCERCFARIEESTVTVPNRGVIHTFTVCNETFNGTTKAKPSIVGLVRFDGTIGGLTHRIGGVAPEECFIGMPVKAVFKPKGKREGGILDIECFKPA